MKFQTKLTPFLSLFLITTINGNDDSTVQTNSPDYSFEATFSVLYLKSGASNTHFAAEAFPLPVLSPNWAIHDICKKYHFGFDLFAKVEIHKINASIFANWQNFKSCDTTGFATNSNNMVGPFFEIGPDASPYFKANGIVNFKFNEVNGNYGQNIAFGDRLNTNFFVGVSYAQLCETLDYTYSGTLESHTVTRNIKTPSKFHGVGPQFGANFAYDIVRGFGISGKIAGAILNGQSYNKTTYTSSSYLLAGRGVSDPNIQTTTVNCISLIVPSLFERIGLSYTYEFAKHYIINAEIGYQAQIYFNVLQTIDMGSEVVTPPVESSSLGVYARTFQRNTTNFSLTGAYFAFAIGF